jgi:predicted  nucleic acid-binding Zn-ribbon protein
VEKLARVFFVLTLVFAAAFIIFFLLYFRANNEQTALVIEKATLKQQVTGLNTEVNRQSLRLQEYERKIQTLETQIGTLPASGSQEITALQATITQLQEEITKKNAQIALLTTSQTSGTASEREKALQEDLARLKKTFDDEYVRLQAIISQKDEEIALLQKNTDGTASESEQIKSLRAENETLRTNLTKAQVDLDSAKRSASERDITITNLRKQLAELQNSNQTLALKDKEISEAKVKISSLELKNSESEKTIRQLNTEIDTLTVENEGLKKQLSQERVYQPIPPGESDAVRYKYLILGEDELLAENYKKSAENFQKAQLKDLALGVMSTVYLRKRDLAYQKAIYEYYTEGMKYYRDKQYAEAAQRFKTAVTLSAEVKTDYEDDVLYYQGVSYYFSNSLIEAEKSLQAVYAMKTSSLRVHALYYLVKVYLDQAKTAEALQYARELSSEAQYATFAKETLKKLGQ